MGIPSTYTNAHRCTHVQSFVLTSIFVLILPLSALRPLPSQYVDACLLFLLIKIYRLYFGVNVIAGAYMMKERRAHIRTHKVTESERKAITYFL